MNFVLPQMASTVSVNAKLWCNLGCTLPFLFLFLFAIARKTPFDFNKDQVEHLSAWSEEVLYNGHNSASPCMFVFFFHLLTASAPEIEVLLENLNFH